MDAGGAATTSVVAWLRRAGLHSAAADVLESLGPLTMLGAQFSYLADPFFGGKLEPYAKLLDDPIQVERLIAELREDAA